MTDNDLNESYDRDVKEIWSLKKYLNSLDQGDKSSIFSDKPLFDLYLEL